MCSAYIHHISRGGRYGGTVTLLSIPFSLLVQSFGRPALYEVSAEARLNGKLKVGRIFAILIYRDSGPQIKTTALELCTVRGMFVPYKIPVPSALDRCAACVVDFEFLSACGWGFFEVSRFPEIETIDSASF